MTYVLNLVLRCGRLLNLSRIMANKVGFSKINMKIVNIQKLKPFVPTYSAVSNQNDFK
jgi:hypothetical protein